MGIFLGEGWYENVKGQFKSFDAGQSILTNNKAMRVIVHIYIYIHMHKNILHTCVFVYVCVYMIHMSPFGHPYKSLSVISL